MSASWLIRFEEGVHEVKLRLSGTSDNSQNYVYFANQRFTVMRIY